MAGGKVCFGHHENPQDTRCVRMLENFAQQVAFKPAINSQNRDSVEGLDERAKTITLGITFNSCKISIELVYTRACVNSADSYMGQFVLACYVTGYNLIMCSSYAPRRTLF